MGQQFETEGLGCGQLVFELRKRIDPLAPGEQIEVLAHDTSIRLDLLAWCRMTGHTLVLDAHPIYRIQRKQN